MSAALMHLGLSNPIQPKHRRIKTLRAYFCYPPLHGRSTNCTAPDNPTPLRDHHFRVAREEQSSPEQRCASEYPTPDKLAIIQAHLHAIDATGGPQNFGPRGLHG